MYFCILCHIFLANYSGKFDKPHTRNGPVFFVLVNIANMNLLRSYHGEGTWSFCVSLCTVYLPFVLLALNCTGLGALQYWLSYVSKCKASAHKSMCYRLFSQGWDNQTPSPWHAAIHVLQLHSEPEACSYWPFKWPTPGPETQTTTSYHALHVLLHTRKRCFIFELWPFQNVKAVLEQYFPCRKNQAGNPLNN